MTFDTTRALLDVETSRDASRPVPPERIDDLNAKYPELTRVLDRLQYLEDVVEEYGDPEELSEALARARFEE